jgi:hypothetical protein
MTLNNELFLFTREICMIGKGKAIRVRGREGPYGFETSRLPHFLKNWLTCGGEVSPTGRLLFTPRKIPGIHFCYRLSRTQGHSAARKIKSIEDPVTSSEIEPATFRLVA